MKNGFQRLVRPFTGAWIESYLFIFIFSVRTLVEFDLASLILWGH
jgi:hypothetical protein